MYNFSQQKTPIFDWMYAISVQRNMFFFAEWGAFSTQNVDFWLGGMHVRHTKHRVWLGGVHVLLKKLRF